MKTIPALLAACLFSASAHAALIDRGNGLIYDDILHVTWLQDANYAKTSGYDSDGRMTWQAANTWAAGLNYSGLTGWRLPATSYPPGYLEQYQSIGYNKWNTSELAFMYYVNLGLTGTTSIEGVYSSSVSGLFGNGSQGGAADIGPFKNVQNAGYFSATEWPQGTVFLDALAWYFNNATGLQDATYKWDAQFAWAVHDGDVAVSVVPEPGSAVMVLAGLLLIAGYRRRVTTRL